MDEEIRAFAEPWRDLLEFDVPARVSAMLEPRGMQVQAFEDALGPLNLDFFSVLVTRMPMVEGSRYTPAELFQRMRLSINEFIATAVSEFTPYEGSDDARWRSNTPIGTVFRINVAGPDNAAVVASLVEQRRWRFSTITTPGTGTHPVSGNREWGYAAVGNAHLFYTRGADRTTGVLETLRWDLTFGGAMLLWGSLQRRLVNFINERDGAAEMITATSRPFIWSSVVRALRLRRSVRT